MTNPFDRFNAIFDEIKTIKQDIATLKAIIGAIRGVLNERCPDEPQSKSGVEQAFVNMQEDRTS